MAPLLCCWSPVASSKARARLALFHCSYCLVLLAGLQITVSVATLQLPQQALDVDHIRAVQPLYETAEGLETPIQLLYLTALLGFLAFGAYLVVRQVLIRRELDEAAKALGERIRTGEATCEVRLQRQWRQPVA